MKNDLIGKFVIVRCRDAGVHAGVLIERSGRECVIDNSRRLWRFQVPKGASSFLSGVATDGLAHDSRLGGEVSRMVLTETSEIIECTPKATASIKEWPTCKRTK